MPSKGVPSRIGWPPCSERPREIRAAFSACMANGLGQNLSENLVVRQFKDEEADTVTPIVVEFNPGAFSTQTELFQAFFNEVAKALGRKDAAEVALKLAKTKVST